MLYFFISSSPPFAQSTSSSIMECRDRVALQYRAAILRAQVNLQQAEVDMYVYLEQKRLRRRRGGGRPRWSRLWLGPVRREQFGLYDQLMVELRREDPVAFKNFLRMDPEMFDEMLARLTPRLTKQLTWMRKPLDPGLKLAITLRHLASGAKYMDMRYGWRVPHNTISIVVREVITNYLLHSICSIPFARFIPFYSILFHFIPFYSKNTIEIPNIFLINMSLFFQVCQAIIDEYAEELMPVPTSVDDWREIADGWLKRWNFPHCLGSIDGKHIACKCPPNSGSTYFNYKKFFSVVLLAVVDSDYKFRWIDIGGRGAAGDAQVWNASDLKAALDDGSVNIPPPDPLPNDNVDVPYFIVGKYLYHCLWHATL